MKLLVVMAGPNGSGKSTIAEEEQKSPCFPRLYINPDTIARSKGLAQYSADLSIPRDALHAADAIRKACIDSGESFAYEAITSLAYMQYAKTQGYKVELIFITTLDPEINKERVRKRVANGGHFISTERIEANYARCMAQLADAVRLADEAKIYDNSHDHPQLVFHKLSNADFWVISPQTRPTWVDEFLIQPLLASGDLPEMALS